MATKRIAIRTDANSEIGTGHFMRCLTLADALKKNDALVSFVVRDLPPYLAQMLQDRKIDCYSLPDVVSAGVIDELPHSQWLKVSQRQDAEQTLEFLANTKSSSSSIRIITERNNIFWTR
jgi:UDP-2,4-diacetamido-2,4,6-trideoxy-beta-L-altropyranose hydrolase